MKTQQREKEIVNIRDLTSGSIPKKLYRFALPILMINLLQAVYNVVDMIIVGQFTGPTGMVAVNIGGQIAMIVFVVISAMSNAEAALTGQLFAKKDQENLENVTHTMLTFALILVVVITAGLISLSGPILHGIDVPEAAFRETRQYMIIYIAGTFFVYIYNTLYGLLRGVGESTAPMRFAIISTFVNLGLDYLFVGVFRWGAAGAAFATILAQALSMVQIILFLSRRKHIFRFSIKRLGIQKAWMRPLLKIGFPQVLQFTLTNFSFILISALINGFGVDAAAAAGAVNKVYSFAALAGQAVMAALITFTAQNLPKQNYKRILTGLGFGILLSAAFALAWLAVCEGAPAQMLGLFTKEPAVIAVGIPFMRIFVLSFVVESVMFCLFGVLTGAGHTHITMSCALISAFAVRYLLSWVFGRWTGLGFSGIAIAYVIAPFTGIVICSIYIRLGKWKKPRVRV